MATWGRIYLIINRVFLIIGNALILVGHCCNMDLTKEAYDRAVEVLEKCVSKKGFYAASPGYKGVWARDSAITSLGASLLGNKFKKAFRNSLETLGREQSERGQIPNAVMYDVSPPKVDYKSIDSSLWFIIGHYMFRERYRDSSLFDKKKVEEAFRWVWYQDTGEDGMPEQHPTSDWQDAFPHRYGHTINTQALYFRVLNLMGKKKEAEMVRKAVHGSEDGLWNGKFYIPWRWKNHNKYKEMGDWFDSLGNVLAIVFDLADKNKTGKILNYIKKKGVARPYPMKSIYPPIKKGSKDWYDYFDDAEARTPYHYSNAGIWTFIGGFYVLSLLKLGKKKEAELELGKLAEANLKKPYYSEWMHGKTGKPGVSGGGSWDGNQAWNAGMYVLAYESLRKGKVLLP